jgi:hypothetical protein
MKPDTQPIIGIPVWLWVADPGPSTTRPTSSIAQNGPVTVEASAVLDHIEYDLGDGTIISCGIGTPFEMRWAGQQSPDCGHTYTRTSGRQDGGVYTIVATSIWTVSWRTTILPEQDPDADEPAEPIITGGVMTRAVKSTAQLPMGELQTIITE